MLNTVLSCYLSISSVVGSVVLILRWFIVNWHFLPCNVFQNKRSLENSDLTEGQGGTKARKSLEFDGEDGGAAGTVDSASGLGGENVIVTAKEIMRRRLLEKRENQKKEKAETSEGLDQLQSWHKELSAAGFSCEILLLTSKHCPLEESEPATQFPDHVLVLHPSEKQTYHYQTGLFHPVRLIVQANGTWTLQCPIYEHIVIDEGNLPTLGETSLLELAKDLLCSDRSDHVLGCWKILLI